MPSKHPVAIDRHALDTLRFIRSSMETASSLAVPGSAGFVMGSVGATAFVFSQVPLLQMHWIAVWLTAAFVASTMGGLTVLRHRRLHGVSLYVGPTKKFLLCLCPGLLAGAVLTQVFVSNDLDKYLAGMWLLLYGCSVLSASAITNSMTFKLIALMGSLFVVLGMAAFQLPIGFHNTILGVGFGGLHLLFGALISRVNRGE